MCLCLMKRSEESMHGGSGGSTSAVNAGERSASFTGKELRLPIGQKGRGSQTQFGPSEDSGYFLPQPDIEPYFTAGCPSLKR
jgi:hypothetical protein